jgi:hypothetical protein
MARGRPWHYHAIEDPGTAPVIGEVVPHDVSDSGFSVSFTVAPEAQGQIDYGTTSALGTDSDLSPAFALSHDIDIAGLSAGTIYYQVIAIGHDGAFRDPTIRTVELTPSAVPIITNIVESAIDGTSARIDWDVSVPATGQVLWGTVSGGPYPYATIRESTTTYSHHSQPLGTGNDPLNPPMANTTTYYYVIESSDAGGLTGRSTEGDFTTLGGGGTSPVGSIFGPGINMNYLGNIPVGRTPTSAYGAPMVCQRFRADTSSTVVSWRQFFQGGTEYGGGNGGTYDFYIVADLGGDRPDWQGTRFSEAIGISPVSSGGTSNVGKLTSFTAHTALTAGTLYWFVMDCNPYSSNWGSNWISWNNEIHQFATSPYIPKYDDSDHITLQLTSTGVWYNHHTRGSHNVMQLNYADGTVQGNTYMEIAPHRPFSLSSSTWLRQYFTVPVGQDPSTTGPTVRAQKSSGAGNLVVELQDSGGSAITTATLSAASFPTGADTLGDHADWVSGTWASSPQVLSASTKYHLEIRPASGNYYMVPLRKGSAGFGYSDLLEWPTGRAEYSTNSGGSYSVLTGGEQYDLQIYLDLT